MTDAINFQELVTTGNRGEQPENIKQICLDLCKQFLGSVWNDVSIDIITVKRINGGFTNQLYYCALPPNIESNNESPREVAIRLYGKKHFNNENVENERLSDTIIAMFVSECKLGPKIFGLFETGQIMEYYKHHQFRKEDQQKPDLVKELATKMAKIHSLNIPIKRNENLLLDMFDANAKEYETSSMKQIVDESTCETLKKFDLKAEIEWIKTLIVRVDSPIVFAHMDFRGSNIMVIENNGKHKHNNNNKLILCDFEYSDYCYRGFDLGTIMIEWDRGLDELLCLKTFPEEKCREFVKYYYSESVSLKGKRFSDDKRNSIENLVKETKLFALVSIMFGLTMLLNIEEELIGTKTQTMYMADQCVNIYLDIKRQFADVIQLCDNSANDN